MAAAPPPHARDATVRGGGAPHSLFAPPGGAEEKLERRFFRYSGKALAFWCRFSASVFLFTPTKQRKAPIPGDGYDEPTPMTTTVPRLWTKDDRNDLQDDGREVWGRNAGGMGR